VGRESRRGEHWRGRVNLFFLHPFKFFSNHEEHRPIIMGRGIWKAGIVREYDPFEHEAIRVRRVRD